MAKILRDTEMMEIIQKGVGKGDIKPTEKYLILLDQMASIITETYGGDQGVAKDSEIDDLGCCCAFHINDKVPDDGGVFANYDTDVTWSNKEEY